MDRWTNRPRKSLSHDCCLQPLPFWWFLTWVCPTIGYPHAYLENLRWIFSRTSFAEPKNYMGLLMCVSITLWQTNITMEITIFNGKTHNKWSFSIVFCMFTRGYWPSWKPAGNHGRYKMMDFVSWDDMTFPTEWKIIKFHGSKPPTSSGILVNLLV